MKWSFYQWAALVVTSSIPSTSFAEIGYEHSPADTTYIVDPTEHAMPDTMDIVDPANWSPANCSQSKLLGREAAQKEHSTAGWLIGGVVAGVAGGPIGTGIVTTMAAITEPSPKGVADSVSQTCYISAYAGKAKRDNTWAALGGGMVGSVVFFIILSSLIDDINVGFAP